MTNSSPQVSEALRECPFCQGPAVNVAGEYISCGAAWNPWCAGHMVKTDVECWNARLEAARTPSADNLTTGEDLEQQVAKAIETTWNAHDSLPAIEFYPNELRDIARAVIAVTQAESAKRIADTTLAYQQAEANLAALSHRIGDRDRRIAELEAVLALYADDVNCDLCERPVSSGHAARAALNQDQSK